MEIQGKLAFGGDWTADKLERVRKYLCAYTKIMHGKYFQYTYIDAFAGTGYCSAKDCSSDELTLPEFAEPEIQGFLKGSARIALEVEPSFSRYVFIEKDPKNFIELKKLKEDYPSKYNKILLINKDANEYIQEQCRKDWQQHRAVLFLDPYGMQVDWATIEAVASTRAIDLWYLFPLGIGANRLLKRDGIISDSWRSKLNRLFGTEDWYDVFYENRKCFSLFGEQSTIAKTGTFDTIGQYFVGRLKTIFPGVVDKPLVLYNSHNNPLYLLSFAAANEKGAEIAVRIAGSILGK